MSLLTLAVSSLFASPPDFHTLQVEAAKHITAETVACLPEDEMLTFLRVIHGAGEDFPLAVKGALVSLQVGKYLAAAEHDTEKYNIFIDAVKPWSTRTDCVFCPLDPKTWKLSALTGLSEKARCDWFLSTVFAKLFVPMVDAGAPKMQQVLAFSKAFIEAWESDDESEAGDYTMQVMMVALRAFRFMEIIASMDIQKLIESEDAWESLIFMSKLGSGSQGTTVDVLVATSVAEDEFYKGRLDQLLGYKSAIEQHGPGMQKDRAALEAMAGTVGDAGELEAILKHVCVYSLDLDEQLSHGIASLALMKTKKVLHAGLMRMEKGGGEGIETALTKLAAEAGLVFSLDSDIAEYAELIQVQTSQLGKRLEQEECIQLCEMIADATDEKLGEVVKDQLAPWWRRHVGFELDRTANKAMQAALHAQQRLIAMQAPLLTPESFSLDQETVFLDASQCVAYWVPTGLAPRRITDRWIAVVALKRSMLDFEALASSLSDRVAVDEADDFKKFNDVRRLTLALEPLVSYHEMEQQVAEHEQLISHLMKDAAELAEMVMNEASKSKEQALASASEALSGIAKGAPSGASWLDNFPGLGNFDDLVKHYHETLAKQDAKDLISKRDALLEAALQ